MVVWSRCVNKIRKKEETKKTTVELPKGLAAELARRAIEIEKSQKYIVGKAVLAFLTSSVRADDAVRKILFDFQLTDDPEDRLEIPLTVEQLKILHACIHETFKKIGVKPDEIK